MAFKAVFENYFGGEETTYTHLNNVTEFILLVPKNSAQGGTLNPSIQGTSDNSVHFPSNYLLQKGKGSARGAHSLPQARVSPGSL